MSPSPVQLIIVLVIVLLVFGARRLPEIGRSLGSSAREFKRGIGGDDEPGPTPAVPPPAASPDADRQA